MPIFRVTYRCVPGIRWLVEDVEADRHDVRSNWHVFARVMCVIGVPRWVCALRVPDRDVAEVVTVSRVVLVSEVAENADRGGTTTADRPG